MNIALLFLLKRHPTLFIVLDILTDILLICLAIYVFHGCYAEHQKIPLQQKGASYGIAANPGNQPPRGASALKRERLASYPSGVPDRVLNAYGDFETNRNNLKKGKKEIRKK